MQPWIKGVLIGSSVLGSLILLGWVIDKIDSSPQNKSSKSPKPAKTARASSPSPKKVTLSPQQLLKNAQSEITEVEANVEKLKVLASKENAKQNLFECLESEERLMQVQLKIDSVNDLELKEEKKEITRKIQSLLHVLDGIRDALSDSPQKDKQEDLIQEIDSQPPILDVE